MDHPGDGGRWGAKIIREIERNLSKNIGRDNLELIRDLL